MSVTRTTVRFSEKCRQDLEQIQQSNNLQTLSAAIELAAASFVQQADIAHELMLFRKHINELRRNDYLIIDILNVVALQLDVSDLPPHHIKTMQSPALQSAHNNLHEYLKEIAAKNREAGIPEIKAYE